MANRPLRKDDRVQLSAEGQKIWKSRRLGTIIAAPRGNNAKVRWDGQKDSTAEYYAQCFLELIDE